MAKASGRTAAQAAGRAVQSETDGAARPSAEPPAETLEQSGEREMSDTMPDQEPPGTTTTGESAGSGGDAAPTIDPATATGAGIGGGVTAWLNNKRVNALWTINQNRNAWVSIAGVGWKRLANNSDSAVVALTMLSAHAKQTQTAYNYREEADGMIHETYVW